MNYRVTLYHGGDVKRVWNDVLPTVVNQRSYSNGWLRIWQVQPNGDIIEFYISGTIAVEPMPPRAEKGQP